MRRTRRRFLMNRPSGLERRLVDRAVFRRRLIDLRVAHLALRVGACRQDFVRHPVRHLRTLLVGVLRDALVEPRAEIGQRVGQPLHGVRPERQQPAVGHRFHGGVVRKSTERRHLAEVLAGAEAGDVHALAAVVCRNTRTLPRSIRYIGPGGSPGLNHHRARRGRRPARARRARCRRWLPREAVRRPESL